MGSLQRRQREKENLRRAILDAARELFESDGYENLSMRKIAEKIEYSPTTIYLHFKDKDEIFVALAEEGFHLLADRLEPLHLSVPDPIERLREGTYRYIAFAEEQPNYYNIMFELKANPMFTQHTEKYAPDFAATSGYRAFSFLVRCVMEGVIQGKIPVEKPTEYEILLRAHAVWAAIHGVASLKNACRLVKLPPEAYPDIISCVVENMLNGLQTPGR